MVGLTVHNFVSAATGIALALALTRAFANSADARDRQLLGRSHPLHALVLLPLSIVFAIVLILLDVPQTLLPWVKATTLEGAQQTIALGPVASQEAIKMLGTNGGGFFTPTAPIRSRIRTPGPTFSRPGRSSHFRLRLH